MATTTPTATTTVVGTDYPRALARTGPRAPAALVVFAGVAILVGAALTVIARPPLRHAHSFIRK
jgi:hypothetical protein